MKKLLAMALLLGSFSSVAHAARITPLNPEIRDQNGDLIFKVKSDGTAWVKDLNVTDDVDSESNSYEISVDTTTFKPKFDTSSTMSFSSDVIILGGLTVESTRAKAIHVPKGGIHLDGDGAGEGGTAPGQMFSKKVKTDDLTVSSTSIHIEDSNGVIVSTLSADGFDLGAIAFETTGDVKGKLKNDNSGAGNPAAALCDAVDEIGQIYFSETPPRVHFCVDDGLGAAEWRFTAVSP